MIIDATDLKVGRLATVVCKAALKGDEIQIINSEKAVFTGNKEDIVEKYAHRHERGNPHWGPYQPRMPDRFLRRIIRGMLPYKTPRGRDAYERIMCYLGNPHNLQGAETLPEANVSNTESMRFVTVGEVCRLIGGRV